MSISIPGSTMGSSVTGSFAALTLGMWVSPGLEIDVVLLDPDL